MPRLSTPCVYLITNLVNGKLYVGKTKYPRLRWRQHLTSAQAPHPRMVVCRAIKKHGVVNFSFEVLEVLETDADAFLAEKKWIQHYNSIDHTKGYNLEGGGLGGKIPMFDPLGVVHD